MRFSAHHVQRPPDLTKIVLLCPCGNWQIQVSPRARSDMGGYRPAVEACMLAQHEHGLEAHPAGLPQITDADTGKDWNYLVSAPLPRWWVDR